MNYSFVLLPFVALAFSLAGSQEERWASKHADEWYAAQPWIVGCNFIPSTAVNQLEMWQAGTFDTATIDRELGWAQHIGFNTVRVFLHFLLWEQDSTGSLDRVDSYLAIADRHGIRTVFVLFDDCWNPDPALGPQPSPRPGVHNSGWLQCPGRALLTDTSAYPRFESYAQGVIHHFAHDPRVLMWDLYNEPGNSGYGQKSLPLLEMVFAWARTAAPTQPLTAGIWNDSDDFTELNRFQATRSDIITFHQYANVEVTKKRLDRLRVFGRPVICTEYMARTTGSTFAALLPFFRKEHVGAISWGLVSGKSQTIFPWGSKEGSPEPKVWFHDIFRKDGTPFDPTEVELIKSLTGSSKGSP